MKILHIRKAAEATFLLLLVTLGPSAFAAQKPLKETQVEGLVQGGVASQRIVTLVKKRGIDFKVTPELLQKLQQEGARQPLLDELKKVRTKDFAQTAPSGDLWYEAQDERVKGKQFLDQRQWPQAETELRKSIQLNPTDAATHFYLGLVLSEQGNLDKGIAQYREAVLLAPGSAPARFNLANDLMKEHDLGAAIQQYREAVGLSPRDSAAHYALGAALYRQGDNVGAESELRTAIRLDPASEKGHLALGLVLVREKDLKAAIHEYHLALESKPGDAVVHADLASALLAQGESQQALEELRIATSLEPGNAGYHASYEKLVGQLDPPDAR
ncbi:MAG: tetratricopeptide repeat protein [Terriglobia bacterium]